MTIKRIFNLLLALFLLILVFPLIILTSIIIYISMGRPIFFIQERSGRYGKIFKLIKFRTMSSSMGLSEKERVTKIGNILRRTSIDELPELLNIIKGDMSMVGPRPLLPEYEDLYNEEQAKRNKVMPGLTGLAQINGRNSISWEDKLNYDVWYVEHASFFLDIKILLKTIKVLFSRTQILSDHSLPIKKFKGN